MATHSAQGSRDSGALPDVVPFDLPDLSRLSWELGSRVVAAEESTRQGHWKHANTPWRLSVFHVTEHTGVVRVRSPVGRERFFGATRADLEAVLPELERAPHWHADQRS